MKEVKGLNPLTRLDYPDPDVIRVGDTYYMASTTMYYMPGCVILRSYDLINWEFCTHVYDTLEDTPRENLDGCHAYGCGMWAPVLRYHDGVFHVVFIANDTHKTYHFTATDIMGPWKKSHIEGFYHDTSLLFDDDGRVYLMYGNREIWVTELEPDLSRPKPGGVHKCVLKDGPTPLGYEGCHLYKINGRYYAFFIHSLPDRWLRVEACFMADRIDGEWTGGDVIVEAFEHTSGVAQGGIVDTPDGDWYGVIFADRGAVGRIPNLVPMHFDGSGRPVFDKTPKELKTASTRPGYVYKPLYRSDDFSAPALDGAWEFNHNPSNEHWRLSNGYEVDALPAPSLEMAKNTLTQRTLWPGCSAEVTVNAENLTEGGFAGLAAMQYCYGAVGIAAERGGYSIRLLERDRDGRETVTETLPVEGAEARVKISFTFGPGKDFCEFYAYLNGSWKQLGGRHALSFDLRHFTGCRFGLFGYSTGDTAAGSAKFTDFRYIDDENG